MEPDAERLLTDWFRRARESQRVHYRCANRHSRLNLGLGIPAVIASTVVGTAIFASLNHDASPWARVVFGIVSMTSAVLTSLQTFLGSEKRAAEHQKAGARYAAVRRDLEVLKCFPSPSSEDLLKKVHAIKDNMDGIARSAPQVPGWLKTKTDEELKSKSHKRIFDLPAENS